MTDDIRGMVRNPDHITSTRAAGGVRRETLKSRVMQFAREAGPFGFIDEDIHAIDPARPESSFRKRRTELVESGWVIDAGYDRKNKHGQASKVWVHREHALNPPPIGKLEKPKRQSAAEERAAIVVWIRRHARSETGAGAHNDALAAAADGIEAGEHLK